MSNSLIPIQPILAQTKAQTSKPPAEAPVNNLFTDYRIWMGTSGVFFVLMLLSFLYANMQIKSMKKKMQFEDFKNKEMNKKMKMALSTISKMEKNPDLIHSREFNLDYLRLRMEEENFHFAIVNQIKVKVKEQITLALRPNIDNRGAGRLVEETFDVEYEAGEIERPEKRVLFRVQIKLTKLPTQATSKTISQIIDCLETYLTTKEDHDTWQPTIQGRVAYIHWDQKAKPTPLLVLEQSNEGVNVTFRTTTRRTATNAIAGDTGDGQSSTGDLTGQTKQTKPATKTARKPKAPDKSKATGNR
ncbi:MULTISPECIES: hypothetical protein [Planktothricoides]|uniref:Uncharacterized protein n=1 Tax=Planktothricoides raciborskii GIHE-MW2 TaxID=2792601 RepID=A0AAU8J9M3_9CYAN|nr:hypothetical protein [Planktothricoides sp. SR001]KOR36110.1 hypothetical protein AM228_14545 [Planktothricoides sp. SR001]